MFLNFIKQSWLVMVSSLAFGILVAGVHGGLKDRIEANAQEKLQSQMRLLLSSATTFETVMDQVTGQAAYYVGKNATGQPVGYMIEASGSGFADIITLLVAMDASREKLLGIAVLKSNETPGFGDQIKNEDKDGKISFKNQFKGCPTDKKLMTVKTGRREETDEKIVAITGATISSEAVTKIVNEAIIRMKKYIENTDNTDATD